MNDLAESPYLGLKQDHCPTQAWLLNELTHEERPNPPAMFCFQAHPSLRNQHSFLPAGQEFPVFVQVGGYFQGGLKPRPRDYGFPSLTVPWLLCVHSSQVSLYRHGQVSQEMPQLWSHPIVTDTSMHSPFQPVKFRI